MNTRMWVAMLLCAVAPALADAAVSARRELEESMRARPNLEHGAELFRQCVSCHGTDGSGDRNGSVPRIAGQHYRVLLKQLVDFRHGKRWDFRMESLADQHHLEGPQDIADVAFYVAAQDRGGVRGIGNGESLELGQRIYESRCRSCHGAQAEGADGKAIPRLAGQHYGYLQRQMYDAVDGRRPSMLRSHAENVGKLDFEEVRAVADYLSRSPVSPAAAPPATPPPATTAPATTAPSRAP